MAGDEFLEGAQVTFSVGRNYRQRALGNAAFVSPLLHLDREIFYTLLEAKVVIERWREPYNRVRPPARWATGHPRRRPLRSRLWRRAALRRAGLRSARRRSWMRSVSE